MIAIDILAATQVGTVGTANAVLNGVLGLYVMVQTIARFVPTLHQSEITHWFGKALNYIFLYTKTYTKSGTSLGDSGDDSDQPTGDDQSADTTAPDTTAPAQQTAIDQSPGLNPQPAGDPGATPAAMDSACRALSAAADTVVAMSRIITKS